MRLRLVLGLSQSIARLPAAIQPYIRFADGFIIISKVSAIFNSVRHYLAFDYGFLQIYRHRQHPCHSLLLPSNAAQAGTNTLIV